MQKNKQHHQNENKNKTKTNTNKTQKYQTKQVRKTQPTNLVFVKNRRVKRNVDYRRLKSF